VATGRIPKECGVQPALIDLLIDEGAAPGDGIGALANGNPDAAQHLIRRGGEMTLAAAAGLGLDKEVDRLFPLAGKSERELAIVVAAFYGRPGMLSRLIGPGIDINAYPDRQSGFHSHATALHQAVSSGSLPAVKILVEAGVDLRREDHIYHGTPLGWAEFLLKEGQIGEERIGEGYSGEERSGEGHTGEGYTGAVKKESLNKIVDYLRKLDERRL
jgi:Ankyrin repeat